MYVNTRFKSFFKSLILQPDGAEKLAILALVLILAATIFAVNQSTVGIRAINCGVSKQRPKLMQIFLFRLNAALDTVQFTNQDILWKCDKMDNMPFFEKLNKSNQLSS